ncbi:hypothetical protein ACE41H_15275 [Paenibacillus enshidis]|uniref:Uncharacterized protein n=1 Tax=Paenibacillus enshidis TaxID=1458439 RepID=A0ABV5AV91_9BACL
MSNQDLFGYFSRKKEEPVGDQEKSPVSGSDSEHQECTSPTHDDAGVPSKMSGSVDVSLQIDPDQQGEAQSEDEQSSDPEESSGPEKLELDLFPDEKAAKGENKDKQVKFNHMTFAVYAGNTIPVSKLVPDVENCNMEDVRKKLEKHYPELSKQRTKMEYDQKKNLIIFTVTIGRKGAKAIEGIEGYFTSYTELLEDIQPINYLAAKNGHYEIRKNAIGTFVSECTNVVAKEKLVKLGDGLEPAQNECQEGFHLELPPIPYLILQQIVSFFSDLAAACDVEATSVIYWDTWHRRYFADIPPQLVGKTFVDVRYPSYFDAIKVLEIHSHNTMDTYFSSTDNRDELEMMVYGVIGCLQQQEDDVAFNLKLRASMQGRFFNLQPSYIFDHPIPDQNILNNMLPDSNRPLRTDYTHYPVEWVSRLKISGGGKMR